MTHLRTCIVAGLLLVPALASAQSLADVARAEQARRQVAPKATKVYTNDDLGADKGAPRPVTPADPASASPASETAPADTASADTLPAAAVPASAAAAEAEPKRDEDYWRARITAVRQQLERNTLFGEALQSRINALATDFVNRDDPAQRALIGEDRQAALAELARVQNEARDLNKSIADIEDEARRAGVPPGWLR